jgi:phage baseplate assembly protein W
MAYVIETITNTSPVQETALGVKFTNLDSIFVSLYNTQQQVRENLKTLLLTRIGERYMQPTYGTNLLSIIFQPNTSELKQEIQDIIQNPITFWLPYIIIESINIVTAEENPSLPYQIEISIEYSIENFNTDTITIFANNDNTLSVV